MPTVSGVYAHGWMHHVYFVELTNISDKAGVAMLYSGTSIEFRAGWSKGGLVYMYSGIHHRLTNELWPRAGLFLSLSMGTSKIGDRRSSGATGFWHVLGERLLT
jgi:hypothetical protein